MNSKKAPGMMSYIDRLLIGLLPLVLVFTASCAPSPRENAAVDVDKELMVSYLADKPEVLKPFYRKVLREGKRNAVLNHMEAGLAAMDTGAYCLAAESFDQALSGIEKVYADNERAAKARSLWYEEGMKDFKGEPYERAMAYYYRGLLYLMDADYENARACFKSGVLQDAFAEEEQHRCDFALLIFLEGWASQLLDDTVLAKAAYREVGKLRSEFVPPDPEHNCLVIAGTGNSPRKLADGVGHYELKLFRGKGFAEKAVKIRMDGQWQDMYAIEDIAWQAMTRGGRAIDHILKGQVAFKQKHEKIGSVVGDISANAMVAAPLFENAASDIQGISGALGLVSVAEMAISQSAKPRADTRYWDNLPDAVHVFTCKASASSATPTVVFEDGDGNVVARKKVALQFDAKGNGVGWVRSRSAIK